jgi:2-O-(6-phospho-alpha-D-mannosyl)-D-glycerate hydrolase
MNRINIMKKMHYHVISNTHWDREWRYPFQVYRMELVSLMDRLLNILEKCQDYRAFLLDSQTVILEDYLEIRPENEDKIKRFVEEDRLQIGPWFTLPDAWACPGEALVRNLLMGHKTAKKFGPVSKVGYTPFSNGQISQLPQIYREFGIDNCFFYRGVGKHVAKPEFLWDSPDGSRVFAFRFGDYARYNYYYLVYRPCLTGRFVDDREYVWTPDEVPFHVAVDSFQDRQYGWINQKLTVHEENIDKALSDARKFTEADTATNHLLYMMGHDHSFAAEEEIDLIFAAHKHLDHDSEIIVHSALNDYLKLFRKEVGELEILEGEMRHTNKIGLWTNLMAEILSCRLYLKQENADVNNRVIFGSEPLAALAWLNGTPYPRPFFDIAWKKILINQAHDAVGGCSVDPVHREMMSRWSEVKALSDEICRNSMRDILAGIDASSISPDNFQFTVFNTLACKRSGVFRFIIDIPTENTEISFFMENTDGDILPIQIISQSSYTPTIEGGYEISMEFAVQRFVTDVYLEKLPSLGYEVFIIKPGNLFLPGDESIVKSVRDLENEFLKIHFNDNGTFNLTDKVSGRIMKNLCCFEDVAENGDPWDHIVPEGDKPIFSNNVTADFRIINSGPVTGSLGASFLFPVPVKKEDDGTRSIETVNIPVDVNLTLEKASRSLKLTVKIENTAKDHRLRVLFPSGIFRAEHSFADGQFDLLKRPIMHVDPEGWKEPPYTRHPMWSFVDVNDGDNGLAVISDGLIEYEVDDDVDRTIMITLLRAFGKFIYKRPAPESQCQGAHEYRFSILPHAGRCEDAGIFRESAFHNVPIQAIESAPSKGDSLPLKSSFIEILSQEMVFSTIKQSENGEFLVIRVWNPLESSHEFTIKSCFNISKASLLTLEEIPKEEISIRDGNILTIKAGKKKIVTIGIWNSDLI